MSGTETTDDTADDKATADNGDTDTTTGTDTSGADKPDQGTDDTDWKAEARKWEKLAKDNRNASVELEKLKKSQMSEQEKAVAEAKAAGLAEAAQTYGSKLAAAELKAAAASKGVDLSALDGLIDSSRFVGDGGEVDSDAIKKAVDRLAKSFAGPKRSGGDFGSGNGAGQITEAQLAQMNPDEIAKAFSEGKLKHLM